MNGQPQPPQPPPQISRHGWYVILSLFVLGALALSVYTCDKDDRGDWGERHGR